MDENYENDKFENDSENEDLNTAPRGTNEKAHKIRISIDIHSIKDQKFRGLIYAKYASLPSLGNVRLYANIISQHFQSIGIKHFKTSPALQINKSIEEKFNNSFFSYVFEANKSNLISKMKENTLFIEIYHHGRHQKDLLVF
jgi:centrosomal protein CEP120